MTFFLAALASILLVGAIGLAILSLAAWTIAAMILVPSPGEHHGWR